MGSHLGSILDQNSTQNQQKVSLPSAFEKTTEKYTFLNRKSTLPKSKNIAKQWEGRLKSHFSHIRNKAEKVSLRPIILERFLDPKPTQDREKVVSKSLQNLNQFFIRFFIDFSSILDPTIHPKIEYFSGSLALGITLGPSW